MCFVKPDNKKKGKSMTHKVFFKVFDESAAPQWIMMRSEKENCQLFERCLIELGYRLLCHVEFCNYEQCIEHLPIHS